MSMGYKVKFSDLASDDLDEIIRYMCINLYNPQAAERFYGKVSKSLDFISSNPYMYPLYHDEKLSAQGYRCVAIGSYLLFYTVDDICNVAYIVRIVYGRRDITTLFEQDDM